MHFIGSQMYLEHCHPKLNHEARNINDGINSYNRYRLANSYHKYLNMLSEASFSYLLQLQDRHAGNTFVYLYPQEH